MGAPSSSAPLGSVPAAGRTRSRRQPCAIFARPEDGVLYPVMKLLRRFVEPPRPRPPAPAHVAQAYYLDGYLKGVFRTGPALARLNATMARLHAGDPRPGFTWEQKYRHTEDLRPNVHAYDAAFVDVLFESDVPALLKRVSALDLLLPHIQLPPAFPANTSLHWPPAPPAY